MKLLDIYDDPDFKISENPIKVKKNIIDVLEKHSYTCSSNIITTVSNIATYLAKRKKNTSVTSCSLFFVCHIFSNQIAV